MHDQGLFLVRLLIQGHLAFMNNFSMNTKNY